MRPSRHALGFVCVLGLALGVGGCPKPSTVLLVEVEGPVDLHPNQLLVKVTAGTTDARFIHVPATPLDETHKMRFPTSFTVSLDQSYMAPIGVSIDALDGTQAPIGWSGTTTYQHVEIGGQTTVTVVLTPVPDQTDGGVDGAVGDGGTAGSGGAGGTSGGSGAGGSGASGGGTGGAGAGGGGGSDGGAGAGGAAGQDAADEADDAGLGLDGAAD